MKTIPPTARNPSETEPATTGSANYFQPGVGRRTVFAVEAFLTMILSLAPCPEASGDPVNAEQARAAVNG